jgi:hypothetical protein
MGHCIRPGAATQPGRSEFVHDVDGERRARRRAGGTLEDATRDGGPATHGRDRLVDPFDPAARTITAEMLDAAGCNPEWQEGEPIPIDFDSE